MSRDGTWKSCSDISRTCVGRPILRLKGHYLAVATLGFGLLLAIAFSNEARFTGGPDGMAVSRFAVFGLSVRGAQAWYWITAASFLIGAVLALKGFAAAMLGGIGSAVGAVIGGLVLGLLEAFAAGYVSSQYKDAVAFLVILIVLLAMPRGLFGGAPVERV